MAITTNGAGTIGADAPATLTNKTLVGPVISNATFIGQQSGLEISTGQSLVFEGTVADAFELTLSAGNPTADRTVTLPDATTALVGSDTVQTLTNKTLDSLILTGAASENVYMNAAGFTGHTFYATTNGAIQYFTGNATASGIVNFTSSAVQTLNALMAVGKSVTLTLLVTNAVTAFYPTSFQVDSVAVTPKWVGQPAPTAGNANAIDVYTFTIIKTAASVFTVLATQAKAV